MKTTQHNVTLLALLSLLIPTPANAATWRVEKDGSGDYTVIQDAVDAAAVGDTILIGPGRYEEKAPFTTDGLTEDAYVAVSTDSLTIRGTDREGVVIGPTEQDFTTWGPRGIIVSRELTSFVRVENLSVENTRDGAVIYGKAEIDSVNVRRCRLGMVLAFSLGAKIVESNFEECSAAGLFTTADTRGLMLRSCYFNMNQQGASITDTNPASILECTFRMGALNIQQGSVAFVEKCEFPQGRTGVVITSSARATVSHCDFATESVAIEVASFSRLEGSDNRLQGSGGATLYLSGNSTADFHNNHILKGTGPSVLCEAYVTAPVQIDLTGNYWGTTSADSIRAWILDGSDLHDPPLFPNYSEVVFEPFAQQPIPTERTSVGGLKSRY